MNIGDNLRTIRSRKNLSQQVVADFLCVDRKTYASWENTGSFNCMYIPKLAKFFCMESGEFFREKSSTIVIRKHNTDNTENAMSGILILFADKVDVNAFIKEITERFG